MDTQELNALYVALLQTLQEKAPWVAEQVEHTVREGKPVARQVRRSKGGAETVALVVASSKLRDDQFAATEELTVNERALVALAAVERLLVDPPAIDRAMRQTMAQVKVDGVLFAEPTVGPDVPIKPLPLTFTQRERLAELVTRVRDEVHGVR